MCHKASAIGQKLTHLATLLLNQLQQEDASSGNNSDSTQQLHQDFDLMKIVDDVQSALRAGVSIQVRHFDGFFFTRAWKFDKSILLYLLVESPRSSIFIPIIKNSFSF